MTPCPQLVFGAAGFGDEFKTAESVAEVLDILRENGIESVDTAASYPPSDMVTSETLLGEVDGPSHDFNIDTKVLITSADTSRTLVSDKIKASIEASSERLRLWSGQKIRILYAQAVDDCTPIKEQAAALDAEFHKGRFEQLGVCDFPRDTLQEFLDICDKEGYLKPSVYRGRYNLFARELEGIFPLLRQHGIVFHAHSPLAGGFLSGSLTYGNTEGTRFAEGNIMGMTARNHYDKRELHDAIKAFDALLQPTGMSKIEAALRWICFHSKLECQDGVIIGASKVSQLKRNLEFIKKGPLPHQIASVVDALSKAIEPQ